MTDRLTISDVARIAGVSERTVSRVLRVIRDLGCRPSVAARGLLTGRTITLGLVIPDLRNRSASTLRTESEPRLVGRASTLPAAAASRLP